jgi:hypothetical protein
MVVIREFGWKICVLFTNIKMLFLFQKDIQEYFNFLLATTNEEFKDQFMSRMSLRKREGNSVAKDII